MHRIIKFNIENETSLLGSGLWRGIKFIIDTSTRSQLIICYTLRIFWYLVHNDTLYTYTQMYIDGGSKEKQYYICHIALETYLECYIAI